MPRDADIVVIGAGIVGAATAHALSERAGSVLLLEQFELGHARGSSHGTSRIFRLNYPDERFVRLAQAADEAWRELERERGERLIERVGSLDLGPVAADVGRALAACGVRYETISGDEVERAGRSGSTRRDGRVPVRGRLPVRGSRTRCTPRRGVSSGRRGSHRRRSARSRSRARGARSTSRTGDRHERGRRDRRRVGARLSCRSEIELTVVPTCETVVYLDLPGAGVSRR